MKNNSQEIYVHIPFCERKCAYCDFVSFVRDDSVKEAYFKRLKEQIELNAEFTGNIPVDSVFFGGGTPSAVKPLFLSEIMEVLRQHYKIADNAEITMEMNPNSVTSEKLKIYKAAGINRVSMGLQSTNNEELKVLSRLHTYEEFLDSYNKVRETGFENVNIDLMSALPGQTRQSYEETLRRVISLKPEHISAYSLIIEEGTPFYDRFSKGEGLPDEDEERRMYYDTKRILHENGYERYEISNYAKSGYECRHNIGYWTGKQYIGFGLAAASYKNSVRYTMHNNLKAYLEGDFRMEEEKLSLQDEMAEFMFLGLRMMKGVSKKEFEERFDKPVEAVYSEAINKLTKEKLLVSDERIYLTDKGIDLANICMAEFLPD